MTERTSHLAGLWIGAAISNTCHSKSVLPLSNEHGSQVEDQGLWQCCHNKHKKFPYRPTHDVSLLSGHASYFFFKNKKKKIKVRPITGRKGPAGD
jgi:hypothetical protein